MYRHLCWLTVSSTTHLLRIENMCWQVASCWLAKGRPQDNLRGGSDKHLRGSACRITLEGGLTLLDEIWVGVAI